MFVKANIQLNINCLNDTWSYSGMLLLFPFRPIDTYYDEKVLLSSGARWLIVVWYFIGGMVWFDMLCYGMV